MLKNVSPFYLSKEVYPGYAGIDNELFYKDNTLMLFTDAKNDRRYCQKFRLMSTKIFCDIADYKTIKFFNKSLWSMVLLQIQFIKLAGAKSYKEYSIKILKICKKTYLF